MIVEFVEVRPEFQFQLTSSFH